ncbi:MAG: hypothetical protein CMI01_18355 [Oceanospirillaceae bacterium]|nr:hypothetical protein [Oceanospirillaceae bacterium]
MAAQETISRRQVNPDRYQAVSKLRFHNRKKNPFHRLPFVDAVSGCPGLSSWAVPRTGGYFGGCEVGKNLARIYLKYLRENGYPPGGKLSLIVRDMFQIRGSGNTEDKALTGQVVGFFGELERWLAAAAQHGGDGLEDIDPKQLLAMVNRALNFNDALLASSLRKSEEE